MPYIMKWVTGLGIAGGMTGVFMGFFGSMILTSTNEQGTFGCALLFAPPMLVGGAVAGTVIGYLTRNVDLG